MTHGSRLLEYISACFTSLWIASNLPSRVGLGGRRCDLPADAKMRNSKTCQSDQY